MFLLITLLVFLFLYNKVFLKQDQKSELQNAVYLAQQKEYLLQGFFSDSKTSITAIRNSTAFENYLKDKKGSKSEFQNLLITLSKNNISMMQLRYLDATGFEKIRIESKNSTQNPIIIEDSKLQDKSHRDYFKEAKKSKRESVFFSKMDLNIEKKQIENPFQPTIRVVHSIFSNGEFNGAIVINYHLNFIFEKMYYAPIFDIITVDGKGHTLTHYNQNMSWGFYRENKINIKEVFPTLYKQILENNSFSSEYFYSQKLNLPIKQNIIVILKLKDSYLNQQYTQSKQELILLFSSLIFLVAIMSWLISLVINKLHLHIDERKVYEHTINQYIQLVDQYIITSKTDLEGNITYVSNAFCRVSGYEKEELIGKNHRIVRHMDMDEDIYKDLWKTIQKNQNWVGDLKNKTKDGTYYWVKMYVSPEYDIDGKKIGYSAVRENITQQKLVEEMSITDSLTGTYNKRHFDETAPKILNSAKRHNEDICFIIMDIDYFKKYNDNYGHLKGDGVLQQIGELLNDKLHRSDDYAFRVGGEEFIVLLKAEDGLKTKELVLSILKSIEGLGIEHEFNTSSPYITVSMGMIYENALNVKDINTLYKESDTLLYEAKDAGRNQLKSNI